MYVKICHEVKLQVFVEMHMHMIRNQPTTFQNREIFQELNNVTSAELPSKLIRQTLVTTVSICSVLITSWITTHLVCNRCTHLDHETTI